MRNGMKQMVMGSTQNTTRASDSGPDNGRNTSNHHETIPESRIGIVINHFGSSYYGKILDGACELLIQNGYLPLVQPSYLTTNRELGSLKYLRENFCEGMILQSDSLSDSKLQELLEQNPNLVLLNRYIPGFEDRCVHVDNKLGAQQVARHLLDNGHTNVAMITGPTSKLREVGVRTSAFVDEYSREGYNVSADLIVESDFSYKGGIRAFRKLLGTRLPFTALFVQNDTMAIAVLDDCRAKGIEVPQDLSVVGFDDHHNLLQGSMPELTTIRQPIEEIGRRAARLMNRLISGPEGIASLPLHYGRIVPELIERQSVALLATRGIRKDAKLARKLTERETECLQWIACGKTSGEIAIICAISESTVNYHLKNTLAKLNSSNRVHAVAKAVHSGIITL